MHEHPVLEVPFDSAREYDPLDVAPEVLELLDGLPVRDARDVLLDDRSGVEFLGDIVRSGADDLHASVARAAVWVGAHERRQELVVDVDHGHAEALEKITGEDLHVASEYDQLDAARE